MNLLKSFFGVGSLRINKKNGSVIYSVQSVKDLVNVIIPHFDKYLLVTNKKADFLLFKSIIDLICKKEHLTITGLTKIVSIKASMNRGLSEVLKTAFPDITPVERPLVELTKILNPNWLAGFVSGEGCFFVNITKSKTTITGYRVELRFTITQHSRDAELIKSLINYYGCGTFSQDLKNAAVYFIVINFTDIFNIIIPFFSKYHIKGVKSMDYSDFVKIAKLMQNKAHLTIEGLEQIKKIKEGMNSKRKN